MRVECAQFRYTWAVKGLDGHAGGFGAVVRSRDWPADLLHEPALRELLTDLSSAARREPAETAAARLTHLSVAGGSLLVAKRAVGTDGAGRPGNFAVHALFDPTGTLGTLDLGPLVSAGTLRLERDVDVEPDGDAPTVRVHAAAGWRDSADRGPDDGQVGPVAPPYGDEPVGYPEPDGYPALTAALVRRVPADLVNQLQIRAGLAAATVPAGLVDDLVARFRPAVELGAADLDSWWRRYGRSVDQWDAELQTFLTQNRPVQQVPDDRLWARWDGATDRGQAVVARELLRRVALAADDTAVAELGRRPRLLDTMIETGVRGSTKQRSAAARWVAAAGDDDQAVDLAAELLVLDAGDPLPAPLAARLQARPPEAMPVAVTDAVARSLDAADPLDPSWRARCLQLLLAEQPTCDHPDTLVRSADDVELITATRDRVVDGDDAATTWRLLAGWLPTERLTRVFAAASPVTAQHVLRTPLGTGADRSPLLLAWPALAGTLGWSDGMRRLLPRLAAREEALGRQRLVLLVVTAVLALATLTLALVLGLRG